MILCNLHPRCSISLLSLILMLSAFAVPAEDTDSEVSRHFLAGRQAQSSGNLNLAVQEYLAVVRLEPDLAEARVNLGLVYYLQNRYDASPGESRARVLSPESIRRIGPGFRESSIHKAWPERRESICRYRLCEAGPGPAGRPVPESGRCAGAGQQRGPDLAGNRAVGFGAGDRGDSRAAQRGAGVSFQSRHSLLAGAGVPKCGERGDGARSGYCRDTTLPPSLRRYLQRKTGLGPGPRALSPRPRKGSALGWRPSGSGRDLLSAGQVGPGPVRVPRGTSNRRHDRHRQCKAGRHRASPGPACGGTAPPERSQSNATRCRGQRFGTARVAFRGQRAVWRGSEGRVPAVSARPRKNAARAGAHSGARGCVSAARSRPGVCAGMGALSRNDAIFEPGSQRLRARADRIRAPRFRRRAISSCRFSRGPPGRRGSALSAGEDLPLAFSFGSGGHARGAPGFVQDAPTAGSNPRRARGKRKGPGRVSNGGACEFRVGRGALRPWRAVVEDESNGPSHAGIPAGASSEPRVRGGQRGGRHDSGQPAPVGTRHSLPRESPAIEAGAAAGAPGAGKAVYQRREFLKAEGELRKAQADDPEGNVHYLLGTVYRQLGRNGEASAAFAESRRIKVERLNAVNAAKAEEIAEGKP